MRCEWNPKFDTEAMHPARMYDCPNEATMLVGKSEPFRLCINCSKRQMFKLYTKRPIESLEKSKT